MKLTQKFQLEIKITTQGHTNIPPQTSTITLHDIPFLAHIYVDCRSQVERQDIRWCEEPGLLLKLASSNLYSTHSLKEFILGQFITG